MQLFDRAKKIILSPKDEWTVIKDENTSSTEVLMKYLLPLALIPAIASFIGYGLIGFRMPFVGHVGSISYGIREAIVMLISTIGGVYVTAYVIDLLATSFGGTKNFQKAFQLVVYSYTPTMVAGILYILPSLSPIVFIAGLYGLYLLYLGLKPMMQSPDDKVTVYFIISIVVLIAVYFILSAILAALFIGRAAIVAL
jgi:hypothetical protein